MLLCKTWLKILLRNSSSSFSFESLHNVLFARLENDAIYPRFEDVPYHVAMYPEQTCLFVKEITGLRNERN